MLVGRCWMELEIAESHSLKDKRRVVKSLIDQVRQRFNVSIAEVDRQDSWTRSTMGVCWVANERRFLDQALARVVQFVQRDARLTLLDYGMEIE